MQAEGIGTRLVYKKLVVAITAIVNHVDITRTRDRQLTALQDFSGAFAVDIARWVNQLEVADDTCIGIEIQRFLVGIPGEAVCITQRIFRKIQRRCDIGI